MTYSKLCESANIIHAELATKRDNPADLEATYTALISLFVDYKEANDLAPDWVEIELEKTFKEQWLGFSFYELLLVNIVYFNTKLNRDFIRSRFEKITISAHDLNTLTSRNFRLSFATLLLESNRYIPPFIFSTTISETDNLDSDFMLDFINKGHSENENFDILVSLLSLFKDESKMIISRCFPSLRMSNFPLFNKGLSDENIIIIFAELTNNRVENAINIGMDKHEIDSDKFENLVFKILKLETMSEFKITILPSLFRFKKELFVPLYYLKSVISLNAILHHLFNSGSIELLDYNEKLYVTLRQNGSIKKSHKGMKLSSGYRLFFHKVLPFLEKFLDSSNMRNTQKIGFISDMKPLEIPYEKFENWDIFTTFNVSNMDIKDEPKSFILEIFKEPNLRKILNISNVDLLKIVCSSWLVDDLPDISLKFVRADIGNIEYLNYANSCKLSVIQYSFLLDKSCFRNHIIIEHALLEKAKFNPYEFLDIRQEIMLHIVDIYDRILEPNYDERLEQNIDKLAKIVLSILLYSIKESRHFHSKKLLDFVHNNFSWFTQKMRNEDKHMYFIQDFEIIETLTKEFKSFDHIHEIVANQKSSGGAFPIDKLEKKYAYILTSNSLGGRGNE
jgi:hypothetical protein